MDLWRRMGEVVRKVALVDEHRHDVRVASVDSVAPDLAGLHLSEWRGREGECERDVRHMIMFQGPDGYKNHLVYAPSLP